MRYACVLNVVSRWGVVEEGQATFMKVDIWCMVPSSRYPNFKHKVIQESLWMDSLDTSYWDGWELMSRSVGDPCYHIDAIVASLRVYERNKNLARRTSIHDNLVQRGLLEKCLYVLVIIYVRCDGLRELWITVLVCAFPSVLGCRECREIYRGIVLCAGLVFLFSFLFSDGHKFPSALKQVLGHAVRIGCLPLDSNRVYWFLLFNHPPGTKIADPNSFKQEALQLLNGWPEILVDAIQRSPSETLRRSAISDRWMWSGILSKLHHNGVILQVMLCIVSP